MKAATVHAPAPAIPSLPNANVKKEPMLMNSTTAVTSTPSTTIHNHVSTPTTSAPSAAAMSASAPAPVPVNVPSLSTQVQVPTPITVSVQQQGQQKTTHAHHIHSSHAHAHTHAQAHTAHNHHTQSVKITRTTTGRAPTSHTVTHAAGVPMQMHRTTTSTKATSITPGTTSTKSKKKKTTVSMATAQSATSSNQGENTGRWTAEEHRLFLQGLEQHGKGWKKIASLIKSRTVVQIRTHAQKYFQKLAKARQNGEEGEVSMENRERIVAPSNTKRRRSGTKRKAIASVVASAERHNKKMASQKKKNSNSAASGGNHHQPHHHQEAIALHSIAPALTPFVTPMGLPPSFNPVGASNNHAVMTVNSNSTHHNNNGHEQSDGQMTPTETVTTVVHGTVPSITTAHGTISGAALEDSLFRFLTPMPNETNNANGNGQVNEVARQAGANPITLPSDHNKTSQHVGGEVSPTVVVDFPSNWAWTNDAPTWYSKGADVDELLNEAEALDWLADSGDLNETYTPPAPSMQTDTNNHDAMSVGEPSLLSLTESASVPNMDKSKLAPTPLATSIINAAPLPAPVPVLDSSDTVTGAGGSMVLPRSSSGVNMPPLPSLFESGHNLNEMKKEKSSVNMNMNIHSMSMSSSNIMSTSMGNMNINMSSTSLFASASEAADAAVVEDNFHLLDAQFDEQAFVNELLDQNSTGDSATNLHNLTK